MERPSHLVYPVRASGSPAPGVWASDVDGPPAGPPIILPHPFSLCIIGERSTGKNTAIARILTTPLMRRRPDKVYLVRNVHKVLHDVAICGYVNTVWEFDEADFSAVEFRSLVICDGISYEVVRSRDFRILMQRAERDEISLIVTTPAWFSNNMYAPIVKSYFTFVFRFSSAFRPDLNNFDDILDLRRGANWQVVQRWRATPFGVLVVDIRSNPPRGWPRLYLCIFDPY